MNRAILSKLVTAVAVAALAFGASAAEPSELAGVVTHVRDGATIEVDKIPIGLNGVFAPAVNARFGKASKQFMVELVWGKRVRCALNGENTGDLIIGVCYLGDQDIGATAVGVGLARDCPKFSGGRYKALEREPARSRIRLPANCR